MGRPGWGFHDGSVAATGPVRIIIGKGNNGGDRQWRRDSCARDGYEVDVLDGTGPFERELLADSGVVV